MSKMEEYFERYSRAHRNPTNIWIHGFCVPLIAWSVVAFLHGFQIFDFVRASHIAITLALGFYLTLGPPRLVLIMLLPCVLSFLSFEISENLRLISMTVFVVAWAGQFYGHHLEGQRPSFFEDIIFLLIGPMWILNKALPRYLSLEAEAKKSR